MAITEQAVIGISSASQLWLPDMAREPLETALKNANYLIRWHRPPLVSACPTAEAALTRPASYIIPVMPSVDELRYGFEHRFICSIASQSVTVTVDETTVYAGGATTWNNIYSESPTSNGTGGLLTTNTKADQPIATTTTALRVTYTAPAAGSINHHQVLVYPQPPATAVGIATSGATPFNPWLIAHADLAAVHTEWINRCKVTAVAVLTSRKQNCLSFLQEEANQPYLWNTKGTQFYPLPPTRIWLPNQGPTATIDLRVLGKTTGVVVGNLIRVRQFGVPGAKTATFAAAETIQSATLALKMQDKGLMSYADVEIAVARTTGNTTRLYSVMGFYTPGT